MNTELKKSTWNSLRENVSTYLVTTSIHGCRYLYEGNWVEKVTWFIVIGGFQLLDLIITELKSHMTC